RIVQAPHWPRSHPFLVPVRCNWSRKRSSNVTRASKRAMSRRTPLTVRLMEWFMQGSDQCYGRTAMASRHAWWPPGCARWRRGIYGGSLGFTRDLTTRRVEMIGPSAAIVRKPRADAARNRERVLEAAKAVFSAGGADASLEAVARRAGVGIGT